MITIDGVEISADIHDMSLAVIVHATKPQFWVSNFLHQNILKL